MEIDWDIEGFGALHDWPEELVIQIAAARMAVDERTLEALLPNPAIEFIGRLLRGRDWQGGKPCKPLWILLHDIGEEIVRLASDRDLLRHVGLFDPGRIQREHLYVDAGGIHLSDARVADFLKLLQNPQAGGPSVANPFNETPARPGTPSWAREMLFKSNSSQFCSHLRRIVPDLAIALRNRHCRHRCRSSADRCSVDEVAAIHDSPPRFKQQRHAALASPG